MTQGMPIRVRRVLHSSLCCLVTLTCLLDILSTSSTVPIIPALYQHLQEREETRGVLTRLLRLLLCRLGVLSPRESLLELPDPTSVSAEARARREKGAAHDVRLELWWFPIEDVARLEVIIDHPDRPIEQSHQVTISLLISALHRTNHGNGGRTSSSLLARS